MKPVALLFCLLPAFAVADEMSWTDSGPLALEHAPEDRLGAEAEREIQRRIEHNLRALGLATAQKDAQALILPLRPDSPYGLDERHGVSNFVDHNAAFPDFLRDYQCGTRTYDTAAGYNHRGTDYFTWPYAWQAMAQDAMRVRAAAGGVIVHKADGNFDRNCSLDAPDTPNAVFIRHADGTLGWYLHLKKGSVTAKDIGETVAAGEVLGSIGSSGISTGPHLHFELHSAAGQFIDPYAGQCNALASRWAQQPDYRDSRLLAVATHDAPPAFGQACGEVERPGYRQLFGPGQRVYVAAYFRDLRRGDPLSLEIRRPDGSLAVQGSLDTSQMDREYFNGAYWYASTVLPENAPDGTWRARYTYREQTRETRFVVGGNGRRASGAWYNAAQSGQGLVVEMVDLGEAQPRLAMAFYAYHEGRPIWLVGVGSLLGDTAQVPMLLGSGARFPPDYDPQEADLQPWGELSLQFTGPDALTASWTSGRPGFADGSLAMTRLTALADINSDGHDSGLRACLSGSWYDPQQSGHGLQLQVIGGASGRLLAAVWYVYHEGRPFWMNGVAPIPAAGGAVVVPMQDGVGGEFPPAFDPTQVQRRAWGELEFEATSSASGILRWRTEREGFPPEGEIALSRLTQAVDVSCR